MIRRAIGPLTSPAPLHSVFEFRAPVQSLAARKTPHPDAKLGRVLTNGIYLESQKAVIIPPKTPNSRRHVTETVETSGDKGRRRETKGDDPKPQTPNPLNEEPAKPET